MGTDKANVAPVSVQNATVSPTKGWQQDRPPTQIANGIAASSCSVLESYDCSQLHVQLLRATFTSQAGCATVASQTGAPITTTADSSAGLAQTEGNYAVEGGCAIYSIWSFGPTHLGAKSGPLDRAIR
jgi:hypothetical protein